MRARVFEEAGRAKRTKGAEGIEPTSVLDNRRSPSPPTSTSSLCGGANSDTAGVAAASFLDNRWPIEARAEWASELQPIPDSLVEMGLFSGGGEKGGGLGLEDWEAIFADSGGDSAAQEQTFLRWITRDVDDASSITGGGLKQYPLSQFPVELGSNNGELGGFGFGVADPELGFEPIDRSNGIRATPAPASSFPYTKDPTLGVNSLLPPLSLPPEVFFQETVEKKLQQLGPAAPMSTGLFVPMAAFSAQPDHSQPGTLPQPPHPKRHHSVADNPNCQIMNKSPFSDFGDPNLSHRRHQPQLKQSVPQPHLIPYHHQQRSMRPGEDAAVAAVHQQQALLDQLLQAADLVEAGNSVSARGILARLNHQFPSPLGNPLLRSAFYFKEALHLLVSDLPLPHRGLATPLDVVLKLGAYKAFSEVSPLLQFTNFTCIQALLEVLGGSDRIHIIDFDIGIGGQWSSFIQELAQRHPNAAPFIKITAFISPSSYHPLELHLTRDSLSRFAADLGIPFEFSILSLDSSDAAELLSTSAGSDEVVAVNLPVGSAYDPPLPTLLHFVKLLSPKIVVSVDQGCDRCELSFSRYFLYAIQSCMVLLDSIDASGTSSDVASKIERFLLQPRIEGAVLGRHRAGNKMPPWRTLFTSAGFMPMHFSNFTEAQAECLMKKVQVRGFHVEKRQSSLFLHWQHRELASVSAWRC